MTIRNDGAGDYRILVGAFPTGASATPDNELEAIAHLQAIENRLKPFELVIGGVESFLPFNNVTYLRIERTAGLLAARKVLLDALGPDKERLYTPHLTLTTLAPAVQCRCATGQRRNASTAQRAETERVAKRTLGRPARSSLAHAARA